MLKLYESPIVGNLDRIYDAAHIVISRILSGMRINRMLSRGNDECRSKGAPF